MCIAMLFIFIMAVTIMIYSFGGFHRPDMKLTKNNLLTLFIGECLHLHLISNKIVRV